MATPPVSRLRRLTILAAILGLVLAMLSRGVAYAAATYYVSPNGNDSAAGTSASPWRTIQKAASTLQPGQTAIVAAGNYGERVRDQGFVFKASLGF